MEKTRKRTEAATPTNHKIFQNEGKKRFRRTKEDKKNFPYRTKKIGTNQVGASRFAPTEYNERTKI
jgi:hypothetical protein